MYTVIKHYGDLVWVQKLDPHEYENLYVLLVSEWESANNLYTVTTMYSIQQIIQNCIYVQSSVAQYNCMDYIRVLSAQYNQMDFIKCSYMRPMGCAGNGEDEWDWAGSWGWDWVWGWPRLRFGLDWGWGWVSGWGLGRHWGIKILITILQYSGLWTGQY